jgi:hypothetical protein
MANQWRNQRWRQSVMANGIMAQAKWKCGAASWLYQSNVAENNIKYSSMASINNGKSSWRLRK